MSGQAVPAQCCLAKLALRLDCETISSTIRNKSMQLVGAEEWVLMAIVALGEDAYGVSIHDRLSAVGMETSLGAIYTSLERLEQKGFVNSRLGEASASRGGRRKRMFRATPRGRKALAETQAAREHLVALQLQKT
ncbi:MAG TPA: PadR family transcriptional regulator [Polyangiales bacterium]|nr:PadR family transcriptional regulator [Polyangiales bacterium]